MSDRLLYELLDRVDRIQATLDQMTQDHSNVTPLWLDKKGLAKALGKSPRWVEDRMPEGMPHRIMGARPQFSLKEAEDWLTKRGLLRRSA